MHNIAIGSRIREIRKDARLSQEEFAREMGVSQNIVSRWERGEVEPKLEKLDQIALMGGAERDIHWLVTGTNLVMNETETVGVVTEGPPIRVTGGVDEEMNSLRDEFASLPLYDVMASAGSGSFIDTEPVIGYRAFSRTWLRSEGLSPQNLSLCLCKGDSMEPTLKSGDTLMIDHSVRGVGEDAIYAIRLNDTLMVKRLQRFYDGGILIRSDNSAYESQMVPDALVDERLVIIGRVVWVGRRLA